MAGVRDGEEGGVQKAAMEELEAILRLFATICRQDNIAALEIMKVEVPTVPVCFFLFYLFDFVVYTNIAKQGYSVSFHSVGYCTLGSIK